MINMIKILFILIFFVSSQSYAKNAIDGTLIETLQCFKNGVIDTIEIKHIPSYILTRSNVTSNRLEQMYNYKVTIRNFFDTPYGFKITSSVNKTRIKKSTFTGDLRWGILLYDNKNIVCSVYFDSTGSYGEINGEKYYFTDNKILKWIKKNISFITMSE